MNCSMNKFDPTALREARLRARINQKDLAIQIGVSQKEISLWEAGESMPQIEDLMAIADVINISLDILVGRKHF